MKIQLVENSSTPPNAPRTPYTACPLCSGGDWVEAQPGGEAAGPRPALDWLVCETCGHLFSAGYHQAPPEEGSAQPAFEAQLAVARRQCAGRVVHRVSELRGSIEGLWLAAGVGDGALLGAAHEFGYDVLGLDRSPTRVARMNQLGLSSQQAELCELEGEQLFDVISLVGCLERTPFPAVLLQAARRLLRPDGVLFLSLPNVDSSLWRELDLEGQNPYWQETHSCHQFSREHLYWLLRKQGFEPCDFALSETTGCGMDVYAARGEDVAT